MILGQIFTINIIFRFKMHDQMDREQARKLIAIVSQERKFTRSLNKIDMVNILVYKRKFLNESVLDRFIEESVNEGLLSPDGDKFLLNFNAAGEHVPIDFSVNEISLFQEETADKSMVDRLLDLVVASGKLTKKDALKRAKEIAPNIQSADLAARLMVLMNDLGVDYPEIKKEIEKNIFEIVSGH